MLAHHLGRWPSIETALGQRPVPAGSLNYFNPFTTKHESPMLVFNLFYL